MTSVWDLCLGPPWAYLDVSRALGLHSRCPLVGTFMAPIGAALGHNLYIREVLWFLILDVLRVGPPGHQWALRWGVTTSESALWHLEQTTYQIQSWRHFGKTGDELCYSISYIEMFTGRP